MSVISNEQKKQQKKYSKLLNNLLSIKSRDQTLFSKVNGTDMFDINSKFGEDISKKIINNKTFLTELKEKDIQSLIDEIEKETNYKEIIESYEKYKIRLFNKSKLLLEHDKTFELEKQNLLLELKEKKQKEKTRWKQYRRKIFDLLSQENIWTLHVATLYISFLANNKEIYAPVLLKECQIIIDENLVKLESKENWKVNEKLLFILEENGYILDKAKFQEIEDINEIINYLTDFFSTEKLSFNLYDRFKNLKRSEIENKTILFQPGVILGIFKPSGGPLRKTMQEIIEKNLIDKIIDPNPDKSFYENNIDNFILNNSQSIIRIQKSNFSQDKALISSLIQDTVIWGPPGTGKSQVIANILDRNKTAIVMSQKKAALDVLKKRLGKISFFVFFILNDNKMRKEEFYKPLQEFVKSIEYKKSYKSKTGSSIIQKQDLELLEIISSAKIKNKYYPTLEILEIFKENIFLLRSAFSLEKKFKYPKYNVDFKKYLSEFCKINNIEVKKILWFKLFSNECKQICQNALRILKNSNIDISSFIDLIEKTDLETTQNLAKCIDLSNNITSNASDEDFLKGVLSERILNKINYWKISDKEKFESYKKFANAVRAGRRIPFKFANDHVNIIQELFPVIITTPETTFINWERNHFDYAVLDESSQMFIEVGLPILYLAKTKILAGDPEQMQPTSWFQTRDDSGELEEEEDVVENADSLLDYVRHKGVYELMLNQNYRSSSASLMSFSSKTFYNSHLDVLDSNFKSKNRSIIVENINGVWEKGVNKKEAKRVIEIVNEEYKNYEKIIILTFNSDQRQLVEKDILEYWPNLVKLIEDEKLVIRNIENIQGDEADLVVASVVYDSTTNISSTYVSRKGGKNALNVAISRAKDKMIVVKSVNSNNLKSGNSEDFSIFYKWLEFLDMTEEQQKTYSMNEKYSIEESYGDVDSNFERNVLDFIKQKIQTRKKIKIVKQYEVGSYSIDLALIDSSNNFLLGIEVDGYKYHDGKGYYKYLSDLSRQEFLENKGYTIFRIKEIDFKIKKEEIELQISQIINAKLNIK